MTSARKRSAAPFVWLFWLACFSLCLVILYQSGTRQEEPHLDASRPAPSASGSFQVSSAWQESHSRPYNFLDPQGLLHAPDVNASLPMLNQRGQVVVADQSSADLLAAFTEPESPPAVILPLKISPDPEAVKQKIAAKQREVWDDAAFKAELKKYETELASHNFPQRANQLPEGGVAGVIRKYARQHGVDARLVWAVIRNESGFNPQAVSPKGAMGLMQLIPVTAALMGVTDPFDIEQNISGGVRYLKLCLDRFHHNVVLALAAYNAGPEAVAKYQGCPPFAETRQYVLKVMRDYTGKEIILPFAVLASASARPAGPPALTSPALELAAAPQPSGLDWKVPAAKFKVAGPTWKVPLGPTLIVNKIPAAVRQNPEVVRLVIRQNARKLLP